MSNLPSNEKTATKRDGAALLRDLEELRDEVRVRIHLGGMELRDAFAKIDKEADHLIAQVPPAAERALNEVAVRLRRIAHSLDGKK